MADAKRTLRECLDERLKEGRARGLERRSPLLDMAGEGPVVHMGGRAFLNFTLNDGLRSGSVSRRSRRRLRRHVWPADGAGSPKKRSRRLRRISGLTNACSCRAAIRATSLALWR